MRTHAGSAGVQEEACWVLRRLIYNDAKNKTSARTAGARELAEAALKAHSGNENVGEQARKFLKALT
jgi:negative regulator of replication initiation